MHAAEETIVRVVLAGVLPQSFGRVQFRRVGWQLMHFQPMPVGRSGLRPRITRSESVSIVILVRFAIAPTFVRPENCLPEARGQLARMSPESPCNRDDYF
jgi:hypothetical protein